MKPLPQPSTQRLAEAINLFLLPAWMKQKQKEAAQQQAKQAK